MEYLKAEEDILNPVSYIAGVVLAAVDASANLGGLEKRTEWENTIGTPKFEKLPISDSVITILTHVQALFSARPRFNQTISFSQTMPVKFYE